MQYPKKKQWALENAGAANKWVLLLDADEFPSVSLVKELVALQPSLETTTDGAYDINLLYRFGGQVPALRSRRHEALASTRRSS